MIEITIKGKPGSLRSEEAYLSEYSKNLSYSPLKGQGNDRE